MYDQQSEVELVASNGTFVSGLAQNQDLWSVFSMITTVNGLEMVQQTAFATLKATSTHHTEWLEWLTSGSWHLLLKLRFLFYLVWPRDTMFPSLEQVPRYVTEVSWPLKLHEFIKNLIKH